MDEAALETRLRRIEESIDRLERSMINGGGEAIFAGLTVGSLVLLLAKDAAPPKEHVEAMLDRLLLKIEERHAGLPAAQQALDHARARLEATLGQVRRL